jgi:hypothetical protein
MNNKVTYNSLLQDDNFLSNAYHSLKAMGETVTNNRQEVLDKFLQKRRYFDTNISSTFTQGSKIKQLSDVNKKSYSEALDKVDQLPSAFSEGGAPMWRALGDYAAAGITDPTNLLSVIAGAFTLGTGGAAVLGAKEAAKQGVRATVKAKIKALSTKPVLGSLAVEGGIAGAGGGAQQARSQNVDMALGRRAQGEYDYGDIALQGLAEGVISPLGGAGINIVGSTIGAGVKSASKATGLSDSNAVRGAQNWLEKWFMPQAGLDNATMRNIEIGESAFKEIKQDAEKLSGDIETFWQRDFKAPTPTDIELVNKAMEGDTIARRNVRLRSPDLANSLRDFTRLRTKVRKELDDPRLQISEKTKTIYGLKNNYVRDIFEKFTKRGRQDFNLWKKDARNRDTIVEFRNLAVEDEALGKKLGLRNADGTLKEFVSKQSKEGIYDENKLNKIINTEMQRLYTPSLQSRSKYGALKAKQELPDVIKTIYGLNQNPALRATETIAGIVEPVADLRIAAQLSDSLLNRGLAVRADSAFKAKELLGEDAVPLVTSKASAFEKSLYDETPFQVRGDIYAAPAQEIFIPKELAAKIKVMTDRTGFLSKNEALGPFAQAIAATQGYIKKGKTVYNPFAHVRNALGALLTVANSGNWTGIGKLAKIVVTKSKKDKDALFDKLRRLGVQGTNVELNQIANRLSDFADINENNIKGIQGVLARNIVRVGSMGVSSLEKTAGFKKTARKAEQIYTKTDDLGKIASYLSEKAKFQKIFDDMSPEQKQIMRANYERDYGIPIKGTKRVTKLDPDTEEPVIDLSTGKPVKENQPVYVTPDDTKAFDDFLVDEVAISNALNVMPVYSRIPKVLEKMRGIPILGSFTAFPAENLRNKYRVLKMGSQEIKDGFELGMSTKSGRGLIKSGANRLLSQGAVAAAPALAAYVYNTTQGTDKVMDFIRQSLPEWAKNHALQVREYINKDGEKEYAVTDLSYNNPDQYVLDIISPLLVGAANGEDITKNLDEKMLQVIKNTASPFVGESLVLDYAKNILGYVKEENDLRAADFLFKAYKISEPGVVKNIRELAGDVGAYETLDALSKPIGGQGGSYLQSKLDPLYFGEKRKLMRDASSVAGYLSEVGLNFTGPLGIFGLGTKETIVNPIKNVSFAAKTLLSNANRNNNITSSTIKQRLSARDANFSLQNMRKLYQEGIEEQFVAQEGIYQLYNSLLKFKSPVEAKKILMSRQVRQAGGLSKKEINLITKGKFQAPRFDKSFWKTYARENRDLVTQIPRLRNAFDSIYRKYNLKNLSTELPEVNIGD